MTEKKSPQIADQEYQKIYEGICSKYHIDPDSYTQFSDFPGAAVLEFCAAGPEVFKQWLEDYKAVHEELQRKYNPNMRPDEIASQGSVVWNCWQLGRDNQESTLNLDSSLRHRDFSRFHFLQPVEIKEVRLEERREILFREAVFTKNFTFSRSSRLHNIEVVDFSEAEFRQRTSFSGPLSETIIFNNTKFRNNVSFSGSTFGETSLFKETEFLEANFGNAEFHGGVSFEEASFIELVRFDTTIFSDIVCFEGTKFWNKVEFLGAEFRSDVHFDKAEFNISKSAGRTLFSKVKFLDMVSFEDAKFCGAVDFLNTKFKENALFKGVEFSSNVRFYTDVESPEYRFYRKLDFGPSENKNTFFSEVPQFYTELPEDIEIMQATFPPDIKGNDVSRRAYRTLKQQFNARQAVREEQYFYRLEIGEEQEQLKNELSGKTGRLRFREYLEKRGRRHFLCIYGTVADYGFSIGRPILGLFLTFIVGTAIYLIPASKVNLSFAQNIGSAAAISISYTLPPLIIEWTVRKKIPELFTPASSDNLCSIITSAIWYMSLVIQRGLSLIFWFFIFLYWRNLARSK